jgi:hypothetical protein
MKNYSTNETIVLPKDEELRGFISKEFLGMFDESVDSTDIENTYKGFKELISKYVILNQLNSYESAVQSNEQETP